MIVKDYLFVHLGPYPEGFTLEFEREEKEKTSIFTLAKKIGNEGTFKPDGYTFIPAHCITAVVVEVWKSAL